MALLEKLDDVDTRLWYAQKTVENGWSRNILVMQIESRLHERQGQTANNFAATLPPPDSDMATQIFKKSLSLSRVSGGWDLFMSCIEDYCASALFALY